MIADRSSFPSDEGTERLAAFMAESQAVAELDDIELAQSIIQEVLDVVDGREEVLVIELLSRFEEMVGIIRDDEGNVLPMEEES